MSPTLNFERMHTRIGALAAINRLEDGACCRLALTDADAHGRTLAIGWMRDAGLNVIIDAVGNILGIGAGEGAPVMTGSHIDTVASGGELDGALGVVAGIEVAQTLREQGIRTKRPIAVAIFTNEEGVRFQPDMMGSLVFAGGLSLHEALSSRAHDGVSLGEELQRLGFAGDRPCGTPRPCAFLELHIEQGPILDRHAESLGVVTDLQGISWRELVIDGVSNHAGTTPMSMRHDAGYCAARIVTHMRNVARHMGGAQVATVGSIRLLPNLINVIARRAIVSVDLRNTSESRLREAEQALEALIAELQRTEGVRISSRQLARTEPVVFDEGVIEAISAAAVNLGLPVRRMTSGAGHDAQMMARICPTAMIFVPSRGGISHNPQEYTEPRHLEIGATVLLQTMLRLAG
jgi:N-carbamoyl-L-amino-acid hydrolase